MDFEIKREIERGMYKKIRLKQKKNKRILTRNIELKKLRNLIKLNLLRIIINCLRKNLKIIRWGN